ncbi:diguanylate cyclase (GGDEF) domain-containing protein [Oceanospirillum multiglobuliferum]|uniref:diguanylate cyclase n=1 Tax=Oceanospirillum multiglobuliferum TaxID=64969 RepID=A0A1T4NZY2_9GAMM|nr:GGDEF domain-containing protein [Oceanospirillum multiglobuliferum]OPX55077.1 hypothetical protein BTE48_10620 [Oceanospirillum multiglobuliferum]SJZ84627.1 diguanylate cyclase (GGDEF) domain-containing protein [Oceanospirillum multiglobuliferum]
MDSAFIKRLENCQTLPSLPVVAMRVIEEAKKNTSDSMLIADILEKDPALASKIVALSNSAANMPRTPIVTVRDAITRVGLEMTMTLALSFSFAKAMHNSNLNSMDHEVFWRRCLLSAVICRTIAQQLKLEKPERFFLAGLIQDIGMLAINELESDRYGVIYHSASSHNELTLFEKAEFKTTHPEAGAWLLQHWGMPEFYVELIKESHGTCTAKSTAEEKCIYFSGRFAELWDHDKRHELMSELINQSTLCKLFKAEEINQLVDRVTAQLPTMNQIFETNISTEFTSGSLIEEAKQLLVERNLALLQQLTQAQTEVAEAKAQQKSLQDQLKKDILTGVYNRAYIENISDKAFEKVKSANVPLSVMFLDIDHFKQVNDRYGHHAGDLALKLFARILMQVTGKKSYVGRYGGEEFVVIMPGLTSDVALTLANRIREMLKGNPVKVSDNVRLTINASIGIATQMPDASNPFISSEALLDAADKTMYKAKNTGRDKALVFQSA